MTSAKDLIKSLLTDGTYGVKVYDDTTPTPVLLTGTVSLVWIGKQTFAANDWYISIGPVIGVVAEIADLGSFNKEYEEQVQIDCWVMDKRGQNYVGERLRSDLVQEVDRCLLHYAANPAAGFEVVNLGGWSEMDEVGLYRSICRATVLYEKAKT